MDHDSVGITHIDDVEESEDAYPAPFDGEKLSFSRRIGRALGTRAIGFSYERLCPERRSSFTHAHSSEEELVHVLAGSCHVRLIYPNEPPKEIELRAGHTVSFVAGTGIAHTFVNHGTEECVLLVVGERKPDDRVYYPEDAEYDQQLRRARPQRHWQRG